MFWFVLIVFLLFLWTFALLSLDGPNMSEFDTPVGQIFEAHPDDPAADERIMSVLGSTRAAANKTKSLKKGFAIVRDFADNLSADLESDCEFITVEANGVSCEWAIAPNVDTNRRVLFLHGGAFMLGSPKGHRKYAHTLSHMANAAVLSVDYRMMPENSRMAASRDAQSAYHWILENGPAGAVPLEWLLVAGDSAGGNLSLMLSSWSTQQNLRKADAVIAFSPNTDTTIGGNSYRSNRSTDKILGEALGALAKLPKTLSLWIGAIAMRASPSNPLVSPIFGDLSNLAPTLIHASSSEMMIDDAIRYTNKAKTAGSDVTLQIWKGQLHDWHLFNMGHGSANTAWDEVAKFIARV